MVNWDEIGMAAERCAEYAWENRFEPPDEEENMTMPHLMNCSHSADGWCLGCVKEQHDELDWLRKACSKTNDEICQTLGKVLDYPWFKDDQEVFPGAVEADGVCVGDHVAESIAMEAARKIEEQKAEIDKLKKDLEFAWLDN